MEILAFLASLGAVAVMLVFPGKFGNETARRHSGAGNSGGFAGDFARPADDANDRIP
jgi:hypothetical protein